MGPQPQRRTSPETVASLCRRALPAEGLTAGELSVCWWDGPGSVIGGDGGAVAVVARGDRGFVRLLAVPPERQRSGVGVGLLEAAHDWLRAAGCASVTAGGEAPFYLWPGVPTDLAGAAPTFAAAGYCDAGFEWVNMRYPASFRAPPPSDVVVRRPHGPAEVGGLAALVAREWPQWSAEVERAVERGTCIAALDSRTGAVVAFVCHSVVRAGWLGPMATDPGHGRGGVGTALLGAVAAEVEALGRGHVEVEWVGPTEFYAKAAGAVVSRSFRVLQRPL